MASASMPYELLENIGKHLNNKTAVSRFRAVCKSLRSSIPPFKKPLQFPIRVQSNNDNTYTITESIVYYLAPPADDPCKRSWLTKLTEGESGKTQMLHPLSQIILKQLPKSFPKVFNLLEYRVFELAKVYSLHYEDSWIPSCKLAMSLNLDFTMAMVIMGKSLYCGKLGVDDKGCIEVSWLSLEQYCSRSEDHNIIIGGMFEDVIFHKGKFYAVRWNGTVVVVDSSLNVKVLVSEIKCSSQLGFYGCTHKKNLVESFGELLLVDRCSINNLSSPTEYKFKVFIWSAVTEQWVELEKEALDDQILIVGDDGCFSVSTRDFPGCAGNCIYFSTLDCQNQYHKSHELAGMFDEIGVFSFMIGNHLPLTSYTSCDNIFNPPPISSSRKTKKNKKTRTWTCCWPVNRR